MCFNDDASVDSEPMEHMNDNLGFKNERKLDNQIQTLKYIDTSAMDTETISNERYKNSNKLQTEDRNVIQQDNRRICHNFETLTYVDTARTDTNNASNEKCRNEGMSAISFTSENKESPSDNCG